MSLHDDYTSAETVVDGLFNYVLHQEIGRGATSVVFRATCRRGRLRNRQVAIKKTSLNSKPHNDNDRVHSEKNALAVAALHSSLCHPSIISLVSSFSSPCGFHYVLELCEHGSLAAFLSHRDPSILVEEELRGIAKVLVDALVYLKKERIMHRDIKPSNILLTADFRVKLSGFSSAVRLSTLDSVETAFYGSANYISPEILSGQPYSFGTDIWSLGCVFITCLSGQPAFHASRPDRVFDNICRATYTLPDTTSYEVRDLISGLLQKMPQYRTPLHRISSHPFFNPSLSIKPLSVQGLGERDRLTYTTVNNSMKKPYPSCLSVNPARPRPTHFKDTFASKDINVLKKKLLEDVTNIYRESSLVDMTTLRMPPRIVSARTTQGSCRVEPISTLDNMPDTASSPPTPALTADSGTPSVPSIATHQEWHTTAALPSLPSEYRNSARRNVPKVISPRARLKRVLSDPTSCGSASSVSATVAPPALRPVLCSEVPLFRVSSKATSSTAVSLLPSSGLTHPALVKPQATQGSWIAPLISTQHLKPQTRKISRGQLVVLPSKSLLVDFREGERRKGHKGKEVLVISPDGRNIEVYDAPHLSTPCCLAEPIGAYTIEQLPQRHMKLYEDAASLIDQLNSRIHKLIYYCEDAKCTLMANGPPGDIEIHIPAEYDTSNDGQEAIRLRVHRGRRLLTISRHIAKRKDIGEWVKKIFPLAGSVELAEEDLLALDGLERRCMARLHDFLRICEATETEVAEGDGDTMEKEKEGIDGRRRLERALRQIETQGASDTDDVVLRAASGASSMVVPPRPRGFPSSKMLR